MPNDHTLLKRDNDMLLSQQAANRAGSCCQRLVQNSIFWIDHQQNGLICANLNAIVRIPNKFGESQIWIFILEGIVLKSERFSKNFFLSGHRDVISWMDIIVVEAALRQNGELVLHLRVEFRLHEFFWLARKLSFRNN